MGEIDLQEPPPSPAFILQEPPPSPEARPAIILQEPPPSPETRPAASPSDEGDKRTAGSSTAGASPQAEVDPVVPMQGLVKAAWEGKLKEVRRLLRLRADPNNFEAHNGSSTRLTPLMAAAAGGRVPVTAELLVAGADPDLPSSSGVVAGDLADNNALGKKIGKLLGTFRVEIEEQVGSMVSASPAAPPPGSPLDSSDEEEEARRRAAIPASSVRREAIAKVRHRGLALVEKALMGYSSSLTLESTAFEDEDISLAGDSALQGEAARQARKRRCEEQEAQRAKRVKERAEARRGVDPEEERLKRVAEKAAARRGRDLEEDRLKRVAEKAAARRQQLAEQEQQKQQKEEAKRKRLAEKAGDRASIKKLRSAVEDEVQKEHLAEIRQVPIKRKVVEAEAVLCRHCGASGVPQKCGKCSGMGVCPNCSKCGLCGTITGFAKYVSTNYVPGKRPE